MVKKVSIKKKKVTLSFETLPGKNVFVAGDFNDWEVSPLAPKRVRQLKETDKPGHYSVILFLSVGRHEYKFYCDNQWYMDPLAEIKEVNPFGSYNSVIEVA